MPKQFGGNRQTESVAATHEQLGSEVVMTRPLTTLSYNEERKTRIEYNPTTCECIAGSRTGCRIRELDREAGVGRSATNHARVFVILAFGLV